ncbi:MAG: hypothetical protein ABI647_12590, partial [Gemmatimonadota bacterium]
MNTGDAKKIGTGFGVGPAFAPDGRSVLMSRPRGPVSYVNSHGLVATDLATGQERWVTSAVDRNFYGGAWLDTAEGSVIAATDDGTTVSAWVFARDGTAKKLD